MVVDVLRAEHVAPPSHRANTPLVAPDTALRVFKVVKVDRDAVQLVGPVLVMSLERPV